ncbi:MAG: hypothetical protein R3F55_03055 [Alphaproteobacteria bacterium]
MTHTAPRRIRDPRRLWLGLALFACSIVFGFGLALWVALLGGDAALAAGWRFAVTCFGGSV